MKTSSDDVAGAAGAIEEPPPTRPQTVFMSVLRVVAALAIPIIGFGVLAATFNFLKDADANRFLVVGVAIVVGVGGVFFLYWGMNRVVEFLPARYQEGVRPYVFVGPALVILAVFLIYPVINTILVSFKDKLGEGFVGLDNYQFVFTDAEHAQGDQEHVRMDRDRASLRRVDRTCLRHACRPAPPGGGVREVDDLPAHGHLVRRSLDHLEVDLQLPARGLRHEHRTGERDHDRAGAAAG